WGWCESGGEGWKIGESGVKQLVGKPVSGEQWLLFKTWGRYELWPVFTFGPSGWNFVLGKVEEGSGECSGGGGVDRSGGEWLENSWRENWVGVLQ
nr:hypothetical protein [Tanacetum cinerariifolium]